MRRFIGFTLIIFGIIGVAAIMRGVFSHAKGFTSVGEIVPGFMFHAICMALGVHFLAKSKQKPVEGTTLYVSKGSAK